jgi:geranylgeranyl pyrophosphate synthase
VTTIDPSTAPAAVKQWLEEMRPLIDDELDRQLAVPDDDPHRLFEAMRYAALGPGKRLRPALVLAACRAAGGAHRAALGAAAAVELLHAYTLVHDDMPAMDDDALRRGRPTVHIEFGEATAILVGDGLLTAAFGALADLQERCADAVRVLARRAGAHELLHGQARDLAVGDALGFDDLERIHAEKTGALFSASCELGAIAAGASDDDRAKLSRFGMAIGVAFQHADDRDDEEFAEHATRAATRMAELTGEAADIARSFGDEGTPLLAVATWIGSKA